MIREFLLILWVFLPIGLSNTAPIIAAKLPLIKHFSYPLDGYKTLNGVRILGDHKTIRGLIAGIVVGIIVVWLQQKAYVHIPFVRETIDINYLRLNPILFGTACALGALGGDAIKSFFKRQIGIPSGHGWIPWDQLDYILGGILTTYVFVALEFHQYLLMCIVWVLLHPISTYCGYLLGFKERPI